MTLGRSPTCEVARLGVLAPQRTHGVASRQASPLRFIAGASYAARIVAAPKPGSDVVRSADKFGAATALSQLQ
jgi:hypothetical protein